MRLKKEVKIILIIMILCVVGLFAYKYKDKILKPKETSHIVDNTTQKEEEKKKEEERLKQEEEAKKKQEYDDCMKEPYKMETLDQEFKDLFATYPNGEIGIYFTDVNNDYSYSFNANQGFYSGCVTKLFGTIYLIEQARAGKMDLHDTYTYLAVDKKPFSDLMDKHKIGEKIPITTLMDYYLTTSDNTAYFIIIRNIGAGTLNTYFKEKYGLTLHFTNNHPFESSYTAVLGNESLKILNKLLEVDDEYSAIVRKAMANDVENTLNFDDKKFLHKYGEYDIYHNDIGIYDTENPYLVTILTHYTYTGYKEKIPKINKDLYTIYEKNLNSKKAYCETKVNH